MAAKKQLNWFSFDYKKPEIMALDRNRRVCAYLLWAAQVFPRRAVPFRHMVRIWLTQDQLPREGNTNIELFKTSGLPRVRDLAQKEYGCFVVPEPGLGHRFTVDDADIVENVIRRRIGDLISRSDTCQKIVAGIDRNKLKPALQKELDRYIKGVKAYQNSARPHMLREDNKK